MPKLIPIPAKRLIKILYHLGFKEIRSQGSHHFFFNKETKKTTTVPVHANEDISRGLLKEILKEIDLPIEEYEKLRKKIK